MSTKGGSTGQEKEPLEKKIRLNPLYGALQTNGTVCQGAVAKIKSEAGGDDGGGGRDECIGPGVIYNLRGGNPRKNV